MLMLKGMYCYEFIIELHVILEYFEKYYLVKENNIIKSIVNLIILLLLIRL